ncbi:translation initiation factor eIF3h [Schizosaccharomyces cryophilus OY26]|uniref:Eukaryotic translation initiation factor 3 subunit H n=1 Tax=Schizosaccharomyces cryophilus (strain OY26 / ATCC MYA-4695 / CBS 11777 / NBRC 106824 / NRRL Y48691) TaxID=653667 RepID=S9VXQ2_SCHCR|nr:translation initiation factor eIF3h [Schizosaccharomyces cryophilus OY26]EPY50770.1 translation initiation factor eIF3h [Schizosaccharomyces cryophilus OY26]
MSETTSVNIPELESPPVERVELESMLVMNIIKHCRDSITNVGTIGQLVGIDIDGVLQVSSSFESPSVLENEESAVNKSVSGRARQAHTEATLNRMQYLGAVTGHVGWYQGTYVGAFLNSSFFVETQYAYQKESPNSIALVYDLSQSCNGSLILRAFQLTPEFMAAYEEKTWTVTSLNKHHVSPANIVRELPVAIHNSHLATCLLHSLSEPSKPSSLLSSEAALDSMERELPLTETFSNFDLNLGVGHKKNLEHLLESVDEYHYEQGNVGFHQRQLAREQAKIQQWLTKRKAENANRAAENRPLLPLDEWKRIFKLPAEPRLLDSLLISAQIRQHCSQVDEQSLSFVSKLSGVRNAYTS